MKSQSRIVLGGASLALILMYIFPIWKISLDAPQYPEGLGMHIWINTVTGEKKHDLKNINGLNHYIGMKTIEPDAIPELKIMPWFIAFMIVFGLTAAATGKHSLLWVWITVFLVGAAVGLVDFYLWEYDYGHNLDAENAIIKIPGMNYQPPLIGSKKLLNFTASSWPATGGWVAFASLAAVLVTAVTEIRKQRATTMAPQNSARIPAAMMACSIGLAAFTGGCMPEARPLVYGKDQCERCRMTILDERYGAELVTRHGKIFTFDSVECLASHLNEKGLATGDFHSLWLSDFAHPGTLLEVGQAFILRSSNIHSPMGMNLAAFGPVLSHDQAVNAFGGTTLSWADVRALVATSANAVPASVNP